MRNRFPVARERPPGRPVVERSATAGTAGPAISLRGLRKRYGDREAVRGIDLTVRRGEILCFLGPNGAGKTTTVEIMEGFRQATDGSVQVLGEDPWRASADWRARIGIVLQDSEVEPGLSVRECLELYAGYYPAPRDVDETIALVDLIAQSRSASRGPFARLAHQTRYELLSSGRNPRARFFTLFFPVVLLIIFAGVFHGTTSVSGVHVKLSRYFTAGILAMSIVLASYANLVIAIATLRETGVLKRRRATPVSPVILIGGQAISAVITAAIMTTLLLAIAKLLYGVGIATGAIFAIAATATLGAVAFAAIGYAVSGLVGSPDAAQPVVQATTMPLWFLSGVLVPAQNVSGALRTIGTIFPIEHLAAGLHLATIHSTFISSLSASNLLVLAAWGLGASVFASAGFKWLPSTATA